MTLLPECSGDLLTWEDAVLLPAPPPPTLAEFAFDDDQAAFNTSFLETLVGNTPSWDAAGINATGGTGNSGFLQTSPNEQAVLWATPRAWSTNETLTLSVIFKARVTAGTTCAGEGIRLGFDASATGVLSGGQYLAVGIEDGSASDNGQLAVTSRESATTTTKSGTDLGVLTDNRWYELRGTFTENTASGSFAVTAALHDWGADGLTGGAQVGSTFSTTVNGLTTLWNDTETHFGFRASNASGKRVRGLDDFSATTDLYPPSYGSVTARDTTAIENDPRRFMRLRVTAP